MVASYPGHTPRKLFFRGCGLGTRLGFFPSLPLPYLHDVRLGGVAELPLECLVGGYLGVDGVPVTVFLSVVDQEEEDGVDRPEFGQLPARVHPGHFGTAGWEWHHSEIGVAMGGAKLSKRLRSMTSERGMLA